MGSNVTAFQEEVFGDGYAERLPKPDAETGALFVGQVRLRGKMADFQLHPKSAKAQRSDFRLAVQDRRGAWHSFGWARWRDDQNGVRYIEYCFQHPDAHPRAAWFRSWPDENQPKEADNNVYFTLKRSMAVAAPSARQTDEFGFDDAIPY
ncbi:MAG: hypothetical protein RLW87_07955 [Alphaproteobacteria bacterium]